MKHLGEEHPTTIAATKHLADFLLETSSSLSEMEALYRRVLAMEQRTVGEYCVATLETKYKLATILELQRKVQCSIFVHYWYANYACYIVYVYMCTVCMYDRCDLVYSY